MPWYLLCDQWAYLEASRHPIKTAAKTLPKPSKEGITAEVLSFGVSSREKGNKKLRNRGLINILDLILS